MRRAEAAGYTDLWSGETNGPDGFTPLALAAAWTESVRLGTGVVGVFQRGPALLAQQAAALADASGGRFALGVGASSDRIVEGWNGIPFERPLSKVGDTIEFLRPALAGERTPNGFKLEAPPPPIPIILAALRGKMLRLAVERADGAFTNFLPISGLARVTDQLEGAAPSFELLCRFFCLPGEREQIEPIARFMFASYVTVPVYAAFYRWLGHTDAIAEMCEAWAAKDRERAIGRRPLGADRGDVHPRVARPDARAARRVRRRWDHLPGADPDHDPRPAGRVDRGAGAALTWPSSAAQDRSRSKRRARAASRSRPRSTAIRTGIR